MCEREIYTRQKRDFLSTSQWWYPLLRLWFKLAFGVLVNKGRKTHAFDTEREVKKQDFSIL